MKALAISAAVLLAGLGAAPAVAQTEPSFAVVTTPPFKLIDNVYYVGNEGLGVFLIVTPAGDILMDVGMPSDAAVVEKRIGRLGFRLADIKIILNTHGHNDHAGGIAKLKRDTGATFIASEGDRLALEHGFMEGAEGNHLAWFPPVKVDRIIKDGETVSLGGVTLTAHLTPGHTRGCTTWTWPVKDADGSAHTVIDFCSGTIGPNNLVPEQYPGIVADYRHTFAIAKSLPGDVVIGPHNEFFDLEGKFARIKPGAPSPFIDRAGYERQIDAWQADFEAELKDEGGK